MPSFDYIASADLRSSLECDYAEMHRCNEVNAWKSAVVLAGSIVEALLVDHLITVPNSTRPNVDPLKIDLAQAIAICKSEGVLSARSADLCAVIRSYRNLIHPGRMIRMEEAAPSKSTTDISTALVDLIVEEVAKVRRAAVGLTAEQVVSKIVRDSGSLTILKHLLDEVSEAQREKLLLVLLPKSYFEHLEAEDFDTQPVTARLSDAYRLVLETVSPPVRERVAREFVRVLKQEDGNRVATYRDAFFRAGDLAHVPAASVPLVKEHLLAAVASIHTSSSLRMIDGIGPFLVASDRMKWADPFLTTLISPNEGAAIKTECRREFLATTMSTSKEFDESLAKRLTEWIRHHERLGNQGIVEIITKLEADLDAFNIPF